MLLSAAHNVVILDFETTGLSPDQGDRAIEIGAVKIRQGEVVETFQELMNPGRKVDGFIESYTGISNSMLADARPASAVMRDFADFIGADNLVAHNASFDRRFLDAELGRISLSYPGQFVCSMLAARRIFQQSPNYRLATLVEFLNIPAEGVFHRALYDSQMTTGLWLAMLESVAQGSRCAQVPFALMQKITRTSRQKFQQLLENAAMAD